MPGRYMFLEYFLETVGREYFTNAHKFFMAVRSMNLSQNNPRYWNDY